MSTILILTGCFGQRIHDGNGGVLGKDGDAALTFEVVRIHNTLGHLLVFAEGMGLAQEEIHKRGFAVVNVCDDGDISEIGSFDEHLIPLVWDRQDPCLGEKL